MLIKLLKYEFRSTSRTFGLVYLIMMVLCTLTGLLDQASELLSAYSSIFVTLLMVTALFFFGAVVITTVLNIGRFQKGVFGDEGYLLHTLPVHVWEIIASKLIAALVWTLGTVLVMGLSLFVMILASSAISLSNVGFFFRSLIQFVSAADPTVLTQFLLSIGLMLAMLITLILQVYASISLGHLFPSHRTAWAVVIFFLLNMIQDFFFKLTVFRLTPTIYADPSGLLSFSYAFGEINMAVNELSPLTPSVFLFYLAAGALLWLCSQLVLSKRLNLV